MYEIDASGNFVLPALPDMVRELYARQGDIVQFLFDMAGKEPADELRRQQLMFEIMYVLKRNPEQESQWNMLIQLSRDRQAAIAEANLLRYASAPTTAEAKPEKVMAILERFCPERWSTRRGPATKQSKRQEAFEQLIK